MEEVHIGKKIKEVFLKSSMSVSCFADAIHRTRTTVYDIFNRKSIDTDLLIQISRILKYDFLGYIHNVGFIEEEKDEKLYILTEITNEQLANLIGKEENVVLLKKIKDKNDFLEET